MLRSTQRQQKQKEKGCKDQKEISNVKTKKCYEEQVMEVWNQLEQQQKEQTTAGRTKKGYEEQVMEV